MRFIDTHAHLYSSPIKENIEGIMKNAMDNGIDTIIMPAIDSSTLEAMLEVGASYPKNCMAMMGLHPCSVNPDSIQNELEAIRKRLETGKYIAVGEIGIDLFWDKTHAELQQEVFAQHIDWALEFDLPIAIHSRSAFQECYDIVKAKQNGKLRGVFHCFSDGIAEAEKVIALGGFYLGVGGTVTFKNSGVDKVVEHVSLEHIVLETDSPYLAPVPYRGQRNESAYLLNVAQKIADLKLISLEEVARITTENSKNLFRI